MKLLTIMLAGLALAVFPVARAGAADAAPTPCTGNVATDAAGDQKADQIPLLNVPAAASQTEDNTDLRALFFNFRDGKLTANIVLTNAAKDVSAAALNDGMSYTIAFEETDGGIDTVQARNSGGELSYRFQRWVPIAGLPLRQPEWTETSGAIHEGPMGVISIEMPAELAAEGTKLSAVHVRMSITSEEEEEVAYTTADFLPDDGTSSTKSYTVTPCPAEEPATPAAPAAEAPAVAPPPAPPAPSQPPAQTQSQPAAPAGGTEASGKKARKKASCKKKAKKLKGSKRAKAMKKCKKAKKRKGKRKRR